MNTPSTLSLGSGNYAGGLAADGKSLNALKFASNDASDPKAIKEAAKQFEALFMRELIKSMRDATMKSGMLESSTENMSTDMLDAQLSVSMSGLPGGLSDIIAQQLSRQTVRPNGQVGQAVSPSTVSLGGAGGVQGQAVAPGARQTGFVQQHNDAAERVEKATGIPAEFMIGQAGHETGWGKSEIRNADGSTSFNLFGIKANAGWKGKTTDIVTTEYVDGEPRKMVQKFRAYDSYEDSFRDYARMITESPRYAKASQQTGSAQAFATELQRAGYATDPNYATKLSRAINAAYQVQSKLA